MNEKGKDKSSLLSNTESKNNHCYARAKHELRWSCGHMICADLRIPSVRICSAPRSRSRSQHVSTRRSPYSPCAQGLREIPMLRTLSEVCKRDAGQGMARADMPPGNHRLTFRTHSAQRHPQTYECLRASVPLTKCIRSRRNQTERLRLHHLVPLSLVQCSLLLTFDRAN